MPSTTRFRVLGVAGSTRGQSYSTRALKAALAHAEKLGAETRLLELGNAGIPFYNPEAAPSKELQDASASISWADAIILASPDYHGSMSGTLKNFLDHFYEEFAGKLFGYIVASHEKGLTVMEQMRTAVRQCYGWSMPYGVSIHGELDFRGSQITSDRVAKRIRMLARDIVAYGAPIRDQFVKDLGGSEPDTFAAHYR
ncbi:MAG TPA: NAD(P)H-dependent oxidoreductase [Nitrososphaera sp.]|jgi:FMN reductase|nr:NAD(P)H-dependent oxidoreductase [Nitrososphaera sp.]